MTTLILGATGLLGSEVTKSFNSSREEIICAGKTQIDLTDRKETLKYIHSINPTTLIIAAAKVGGKYANKAAPATYLSYNTQININCIDAAAQLGVSNLIYVSSNVMYPENSSNPINENCIFEGKLNEDTQYFGLSKILAVKLIEAYRKQGATNWTSVVLSNLYGPNDNFNPESSHVIPSLIQKFSKAANEKWREINLLGNGNTKREFLHSRDAAQALATIVRNNLFTKEVINVGSGEATEIREIAEIIAMQMGYNGSIIFNENEDPDPVRLLDSEFIRKNGWKPTLSLDEGISSVVEEWRIRENRI